MTAKYETLPKDIEWHFIGHLQTNKIKYMIPYVAMIHGIDTYKLLTEVNKQAAKGTYRELSVTDSRCIVKRPSSVSALKNARICCMPANGKNCSTYASAD